MYKKSWQDNQKEQYSKRENIHNEGRVVVEQFEKMFEQIFNENNKILATQSAQKRSSDLWKTN